MTVSIATGLSDAEVAERVAQGKTNDVPSRASRSVGDIVRSNVFTRINAILGVLFMIVLATGSLINGLFGLLISPTAPSGSSRARAPRRHWTASPSSVRPGPASDGSRAPPNGRPTRWCSTTIELGPGDQIVVDGELLEATTLEVDESLLTGEADPISKAAGDTVMSGQLRGRRRRRLPRDQGRPRGLRRAAG